MGDLAVFKNSYSLGRLQGHCRLVILELVRVCARASAWVLDFWVFCFGDFGTTTMLCYHLEQTDETADPKTKYHVE